MSRNILAMSLKGPRPWDRRPECHTGLAVRIPEELPRDEYLELVAKACLGILSKEVKELYHQELAQEKFQEILEKAMEKRRESTESALEPEGDR